MKKFLYINVVIAFSTIFLNNISATNPLNKSQKSFYLDDISGSFNFLSSGNYTLNDTNVSQTTVNNNLNYASFEFYTDKGITTDYEVLVKNLNSMFQTKRS